MIQFEKFELDNGLKVIVHQDTSTPMAVVNVLYSVGAKDEDPKKTGFAHLFEHLMFGGSIHIPVYDEPLQRAGGENNAYTTNDLTNYYCQIPAENIETAFWLESDRMLSLAFSEKSLEVQRKVVCEEFKEHYINKPYGDAWHKMRSLAYTQHPYRWMTIGASLEHVEQAKMQDVKDFFFKFYRPNNAILVVTGNVTTDQIKQLAEKWFGPIPSGAPYERNLPCEPTQKKSKSMDVHADVPLDMLMMTWHMGGRLDEYYHATDFESYLPNTYCANLLGLPKVLNVADSVVTAKTDIWAHMFLTAPVGTLNYYIEFSLGATPIDTITLTTFSTDKIYVVNLGYQTLLDLGHTLTAGDTINIVIGRSTASFDIPMYTYSYTVQDICSRYDITRLYYLSRSGRILYKQFSLASTKRMTKKTSNVRLGKGNVVSGIMTSNRWDREVHEVANVTTYTSTLTSDWISETQNEALQELFDSPIVWQHDGTNYIPVTITDTSFDFKKHNSDKLFNYTVNIEYNTQETRQRGL